MKPPESKKPSLPSYTTNLPNHQQGYHSSQQNDPQNPHFDLRRASVRPGSYDQRDQQRAPLPTIYPTHHETQAYPQLTRDRLERKNKLDALLIGRLSTTGNHITRRRSISNGYIFRRLYNEDNAPMHLTGQTAIDDEQQESTEASVNPYLMGGNRSSGSIEGTPSSISPHKTGLIGHTNNNSNLGEPVPEPSQKTSVIGIPSFRLHGRYTAPNSSRRYSGSSASKMAFESKKRLSHLLKLSNTRKNIKLPAVPSTVSSETNVAAAAVTAATIAARASSSSSAITVKNKWRELYCFLEQMAWRVVDTRSCEPPDERMTVQEMMTLAQYLKISGASALEDYLVHENEEVVSLNHRRRSTISEQQPKRMVRERRSSVLVDRIDESEVGTQAPDKLSPNGSHTNSPKMHPLDNTISNNTLSVKSPSMETTSYHSSSTGLLQQHRKSRLGSLGNIFPYRSCEKKHRGPKRGHRHTSSTGSSILRSSANNFFAMGDSDTGISSAPNEREHHRTPVDYDRLSVRSGLHSDPGSSQNNFQTSKSRKVMRKISNALTFMSLPSISCENYDDGTHSPPNIPDKINTSFRFEGWSLRIFGPSSPVRIWLWKILASNWFNIFILCLLIAQWTVLSFTPLRHNEDKTNFAQPYQYILLSINSIYTLEAVAKIIIYGFLYSKPSRRRPRILKWPIKRLTRLFDGVNLYKNHCPEYPSYVQQRRMLFAPLSRSSTNTIPSISRSDLDDEHDTNFAGDSSQHPPWSPGGSPPRSVDDNCASHQIPSSYYHHSEGAGGTDVQTIPSSALNRASSVDFDNTSTHSKLFSSSHGRTVSEILEDEENFLKISHQAYLSSLANILDLIAITAYWVDFGLMMSTTETWSLFKALAATRLLRLVNITEGTAIIIESLGTSYAMLRNVLGFFVFFWVLFSLVGIFVFMNSFSRRCAISPGSELQWNLENLTFVEPPVACSNFIDSDGNIRGVFDIDTGVYIDITGSDGFVCKQGQICVQSVVNQPGWGYISYHNIFYTMMNVFTVISTEGWTDLMYLSEDSVSNTAAAIYYCFCIYLMTFIMVPMFIAVITSSFARAKGDMRHSAFATEKKNRLLLTRTISTGKDYETDSNEEWIYGGNTTTSVNLMSHRTDWLRRWAGIIVSHRFFPIGGSILVAFNMITMMFYTETEVGDDLTAQDGIDLGFTGIFALEIILRILGSANWIQFWRYSRNRIDFYIAIASVVNQLPVVRNQILLHRYLQVFAILRSYRLVYLFPRILQLLSDVIGDGQGIINLTIFTFLVLCILCPISIQLFGGDFNTTAGSDETEMRFDTFYQAFIALFQIMTGENWTDILYDAMHSQSHASIVYAAIFMCLIYFVVHYLVLNLFIAVIMENFDLDEDEIRQIQIKKYIRQHRWQPEYFKLDLISQTLLPIFVKQDRRKLNLDHIPQNLVASVTQEKFKSFLVMEPEILMQKRLSKVDHGCGSLARPSVHHSSLPTLSTVGARKASTVSSFSTISSFPNDEPLFDEVDEPLVKYGDEYEISVAKENKAVIVENLNVFRTLLFLKEGNILRTISIRAVKSTVYRAIYIGLLCASVFMAIVADEVYRETNPVALAIVEIIQKAMLMIFWVDALMHIMANGLVVLPISYFRSFWNLLDAALLIAQTASLLGIADASLRNRCLRSFRTLRAIRIVYYVEGMRVIFLDLLHGLPSIFDAILLNLLVFIPFAIYGCYIFSARFTKCNDDNASMRGDCLGEFQSSAEGASGITIPRVWDNPYKYSYDQFGNALLHLFECASGEGWIMSLFSAMSVTSKKDAQPRFDWTSESTWNAIYYLVFMFVASLCSIQLFIGVILETFKRRRGISSLTNTQRQFQDLQRQLSLVRPSRKAKRPPDGTLRALCYDIVINKRGKFSSFITYVIVIHILVLSSYHSNQPPWLTTAQDLMTNVFVGVYILEMVLKIAGLGIHKWASSKWNIYDGTIAALVLVSSIWKATASTYFALKLLYSFLYVGIAFRYAERNESLDTFLRSTKRAMPTVIYVTGAFSIVILCFAVLLQELFATTRYGLYGNNHANFRTLSDALQTLWRITTGENWDFLMHDFAVKYPNCVNDRDCGSPGAAVSLFVVFYIVCTYIFVNLFTVIVINNFSFTFDNRNQFTLITRTDLRYFKEAWAQFDPTATGFLHMKDVPGFLRALNGVLSMRIYDEQHSIKSLLEASNEMNADVTHLASIPVADNIHAGFGQNNILGERFYNFEAVNRELSTMDVAAVRENKKRYTFVFQEILFSAGARGITFHDMLEILSMQLVDVSKSLTFDELVNHARRQDKVLKSLASEKAKSLVAMLVVRRQYLKKREQMKDSQFTDMSILGELLSPAVTVPIDLNGTDKDKRQRDPQRDKNRSSSLPHVRTANHDVAFSEMQPSESPAVVPTIIVDQPLQQQQQQRRRSITKLQNQSMESHFREPARLPSPVISDIDEFPDHEASQSSSTFLSQPSIDAYFPIKRMSLGASVPHIRTIQEPFYDTSVSLFTRYYALDTRVDMSRSDAADILHKLEYNNIWADMLNETEGSKAKCDSEH
ncbi:Ion transport protein-domain-containing protein [Fennellomyces sp. T-0311]|nr:Ion transport protein-domain-containing protein [Fennellomyces sp. T-0311]